jgi:hypothetical protein
VENRVTLIEEVCVFLQSLGGVYAVITGEICENIAYSLASGQYVWNKNLYFAAYWRVSYDDIGDLQDCHRPPSIVGGPVCYIVEAGSVGGVLELALELRKQNTDAEAVMFHRGGTLKRFGLTRRRGMI